MNKHFFPCPIIIEKTLRDSLPLYNELSKLKYCLIQVNAKYGIYYDLSNNPIPEYMKSDITIVDTFYTVPLSELSSFLAFKKIDNLTSETSIIIKFPTTIEIERKFLVEGFPDKNDTSLELLGSVIHERGYWSIEPEMRYTHSMYTVENQVIGQKYKFCIKSDGDLARFETECDINEDLFNQFHNNINKTLIIKTGQDFLSKDGYVIHYSHVDPLLDSSFYYAEIEFISEDLAKLYKPSFDIISDITYDPKMKMKNYWKRTRLMEDK